MQTQILAPRGATDDNGSGSADRDFLFTRLGATGQLLPRCVAFCTKSPFRRGDESGALASIRCVALLLARVLELLAGLRAVALDLVGLTRGPQLVVAADLAGGLLQLSLRLLGGVLCLVGCCHDWAPCLGM